MAAICEVCGKGRRVANQVSHSNIKTKRIQRPNLKRVHSVVGGKQVHMRVCTRCVRSERVQKAS